MSKVLADKYSFTCFNDNYHEENFLAWKEICDENYQRMSSQKITDWEYFFNRPTDEYLNWLDKTCTEYFEYALIEIIKLAQKNTVIVDTSVSCGLIKKFIPYNRVACMLAPPELVVRDFYQRNDHKEIYECIMSLKNPKHSLENKYN